MSACKYCNAPIAWNRVAGEWRPTNADGSPHFCKSNRTIPDVNEIAGPRIVGVSYRPACGDCDLPPWEVCACSALLEAVA